MRLYLFFALFLCLIPVLSIGQMAGSLDHSFDGDGIQKFPIGNSNAFGRSVIVQPDGRLAVACIAHNGVDNDFALLRFTSDGKLDSTIGTNGIAFTDFGFGTDIAESIALDSSNKILIAGSAENGNGFDFAVARYEDDGNLDPLFSEGGRARVHLGATAFCNAIAVQSDNKILLAGYVFDQLSSTNEFALLRLNTDGTPDSTFHFDGIVQTNMLRGAGVANAMVIEPDGKIIVAGQVLNEATFLWEIGISRYMPDGSLDASWGENGRVWTTLSDKNFTINAVSRQRDGKVIVAGYFGSAPSDNLFAVARYKSNGEPDELFGTGGIVINSFGAQNNQITGIALQPDDKIIVAGTTLIGNQDRFAIARLNEKGEMDGAFGDEGRIVSVIGDNDGIESIALQPDGKLVVTGESLNDQRFEFVIARFETGLFTGLQDGNQNISDVSVFPNPIHGSLNVKFTTSGNEENLLDLYDSNGRRVHRFGMLHTLHTGAHLENFQWPVHLSEGIYYLTFRSEDKIHPIKIVKSK